MRDWDLYSLGIPEIYHRSNPFLFNAKYRLNSFPAAGNLQTLREWMNVPVNTSIQADVWNRYINAYTTACRARSLTGFIINEGHRNQDERVHSYLMLRRKHVRNVVDPLGLVRLPFYRTSHYYRQNGRGWYIRAQARIVKHLDGHAIGRELALYHRWIRTKIPEYRGSTSWNRWIQYGTTRVGWSTAGTESWFWYEIHCPHVPGVDRIHNFSTPAVVEHLDSLWIPVVKVLRWRSTSNPVTWRL